MVGTICQRFLKWGSWGLDGESHDDPFIGVASKILWVTDTFEWLRKARLAQQALGRGTLPSDSTPSRRLWVSRSPSNCCYAFSKSDPWRPSPDWTACRPPPSVRPYQLSSFCQVYPRRAVQPAYELSMAGDSAGTTNKVFRGLMRFSGHANSAKPTTITWTRYYGRELQIRQRGMPPLAAQPALHPGQRTAHRQIARHTTNCRVGQRENGT